jgi:hypothetical protein
LWQRDALTGSLEETADVGLSLGRFIAQMRPEFMTAQVTFKATAN